MNKLLAKLDIILPIIMLIILLLTKLSENTIIIIAMTLFIGWVIPYIINIITGISFHKESHLKLSLIANILSSILSIILIIFIIRIIDLKLIVFLVEYIILLILNILNIICLKKYQKLHPSESTLEKQRIKKEKKNNNGAVV
jgi:hypothetical protein